jgi:hypothetical protein
VHPSGAPERSHLQLVLPYNRVQDIIRTFHASQETGSHFGIAKTLNKIKERFYWPNAFQDCRDVIASCEECGRFSGSGRPRRPGPMRIHNDNTFLGRWCVDLAGPFPRPLDSVTYKEAAAAHKKWYALVAVETFTCWPEVMIIHKSRRQDLCSGDSGQHCVQIWSILHAPLGSGPELGVGSFQRDT